MSRIAFGLFVFLAVSLTLGGSRALAHAVLLSTTPAAGETVATAPGKVVLHFSEPVEITFGAVQVFDNAGQKLATGDLHFAEGTSDTVDIDLPSGLPNGTYTVGWRVVSADSHPVAGAFVFNIGAAGANPRGVVDSLLAGNATDRSVSAAAGVGRYLTFLSLLCLLGITTFIALILKPTGPSPDTARLTRIAVVASIVALLATAAVIALQGAVATGGGLGAAFETRNLRDTVEARFGRFTIARLVGIAVSLTILGIYRTRALTTRARATALALLAIGALVTLSLSGHASTADPAWLAEVADAAHLLAAGTWFGGLISLLVCLWRRPVDFPALAVVSRFSRLALAAVGVVILTGIVGSIVHLPSIGDLFSSRYGIVLLVKVLLVAVVVVGAVSSRRVGIPNFSASGSARLLQGTVTHEILAIGGVLVATAVLVNTAPPSSQGSAPPAQQHETAASSFFEAPLGPHGLNVSVDPGTPGNNTVHLYLSNPTGELPPIEEITVDFTLAAQELGPLRATVFPAGPGHYSGFIDLLVPGDWTVTVKLRTSAFDIVTGQGTIGIKP